jgi:hypothetical protein
MTEHADFQANALIFVRNKISHLRCSPNPNVPVNAGQRQLMTAAVAQI